jgi:hypothetical protein
VVKVRLFGGFNYLRRDNNFWKLSCAGGFNSSDLLASAKVRMPVPDRRIPGLSLADRSFWENLAKNTQSAGLKPGILRSGTGVLTFALVQCVLGNKNIWS